MRILPAGIAVVMLAVASIVSAQMSSPHTMTGTVVTASDKYLVVDTSSGRMTLTLDNLLDRVRYNDLKPGSRIEFTHKTDPQGVLLVTDVRMDPASANTTYRDDRYAADQLPRTASPLAIMAVVGASALALGAVLRKRHGKRLHPVPKSPKS